jgi:hypothetical protein
MLFRRSPTFQGDELLPSSESKSKPHKQLVRSKQQAASKAGCLLGLLFGPEDTGGTVLKNIDKLLPDYMASHHRRWYSSSRNSSIFFFFLLRYLMMIFQLLQ